MNLSNQKKIIEPIKFAIIVSIVTFNSSRYKTNANIGVDNCQRNK